MVTCPKPLGRSVAGASWRPWISPSAGRPAVAAVFLAAGARAVASLSAASSGRPKRSRCVALGSGFGNLFEPISTPVAHLPLAA